MILKTICFLLILRAGLVHSINTDYNNENSTYMYTSNDNKMQQVDKCAELGIIKNCTSGRPYCFVNGDDIRCGHINNIGWRISPLDGLVLNNGQVSNNQSCTLFIPPEQPTTKEIIKTLLKDSVYGSTLGNNESNWFNIFEYLGNCPLKSQFCDKDTQTCQDLLSVGKICNSSNQCFSHSCELFGGNNGTNSERKCAEGGVGGESKESPAPVVESDGLNEEQVKILSIIITVSICSAMILSGLAVYLMLRRKKRFPLKKNDDSNIPLFLNYTSSNSINPSNTVVRRLSTLHSSFLSRRSTNRSRSSKYIRRDTDRFSVLLPPAPTLSRCNSLRVHSYRYSNNNDNNLGDRTSRDSFDIFPPPQQYQYDNSFHISY